MQWRALDQQVSCMDVAGTAAEVNLPQATCTIQPGECVTLGSDSASNQTRRFDPLQATGWQLPLLLLRSPHDSELQDRMANMLSIVGESKANYMYEDQIRGLGPAGAVPLLAFVNSPRSFEKPPLRWRAMQLVAELAGPSSMPELKRLLVDGDAVIQDLARQAIRRLQREQINPGF
jgi:hypothetical protein